jgi:class 3 adenylate cyclase
MEQKGFHRKLTAILSADVAGYSRLMQDDEAATVKTLEAYKQIISHADRMMGWQNNTSTSASGNY